MPLFFGKIGSAVSPLKCAKKKRWISIGLIITFLITGMCFEFPKADSCLACTESTKQEIRHLSKGGFLTEDLCTEDLLGIYTKENSIFQETRGSLRHNSKLRLLLTEAADYVEHSSYISERAAVKIMAGITYSSMAIVCYIHRQDGEKEDNTLFTF